MFAGGPRGESDAPRQPLRARTEAVAPAPACIEFPDEREEPRGRRFEVSGQLGDLVAQAIELREVRRVGLRRL
jgi:hypothetical protein